MSERVRKMLQAKFESLSPGPTKDIYEHMLAMHLELGVWATDVSDEMDHQSRRLENLELTVEVKPPERTPFGGDEDEDTSTAESDDSAVDGK